MVVDQRAIFDFDHILRATALELHMPPAWRDQDSTIDEAIAVLGLQHLHVVQTVLSRDANEAVKAAGMCCTMTMPGQVRSSWRNTTSMDCTPPVEMPMATTRSVVSDIAPA